MVCVSWDTGAAELQPVTWLVPAAWERAVELVMTGCLTACIPAAAATKSRCASQQSDLRMEHSC